MNSPASSNDAMSASVFNQESAEYQYVTGQIRASFPALLADFESASQAAQALEGWQWDIQYGEHPRETFDFRPASGAPRATLIYLHAGYWQSRDKSQFSFLAPGLNEAGFNVALANYPLCPDVSLQDIILSVCRIPRSVRSLSSKSHTRCPLIVAGHSAGGHLAVEIACRPDIAGGVDGVLAISGIYDLRDLIDTTLNRNLRLDKETARAASPVRRLPSQLPPAAFVVGGDETRAFHEQNQAMAAAWGAVGPSRHEVSAGDNHFMVLTSLCHSNGLLRTMLGELASRGAVSATALG